MNILSNIRTLTLLAVTAVLLTGPSAASAGGSDRKARVDLVPTGVLAEADGRAKMRVRRDADDGLFLVKARGLVPEATYDIVFDDIRVGSVVANPGGRARARFRSRPRSDRDELLGFDPRGSIVLLRDASGADVLAGALPDGGNGFDDTKIVCCIPDDSGAECEDRTEGECTAQGGTVSTATTCLPNPCDTVTPPTEDDVVCCLPDDSGPHCEDRTIEECSAGGGIVVDANSCLGDPCAAVPPLDADTRCCEADDSGNQCEGRLPSECMARQGVDVGSGVCAVDTCDGVVIPTGIEELRLSCEKRASRSRASVDGKGLRNGLYTARILSGASEASAPAQATVLGQVEFDFDSDPGDVASGDTEIPADFLAGDPPSITGQIFDADGNLILEGTASCAVR